MQEHHVINVDKGWMDVDEGCMGGFIQDGWVDGWMMWIND